MLDTQVMALASKSNISPERVTMGISWPCSFRMISQSGSSASGDS